MFIKPIRTIINNLPESNSKIILNKKLDILDKQMKKIEAKYLKSNEDKLTLSHLLTKVNKELEESLNNEKRFIASVSHELRTPLTAILGYAELLEDTALNNKQVRYLNNIIQSSDHLLALISDLLDVAKLEDNRIELSLREFDLDDILNECANLIKSKIAEGVEFVADIPMLDYPIIADDKRVKQIFINLLSNAAKFTKKGSIRFYVKSIKELENKKLKITINVDDTGNGIPIKIKNRLFEAFRSTDKTQGTGLGLYISQQLAYLMDGKIVVESKQGVGSSFSTTIIVDVSEKKEIGQELKGANIMMFANRDEFIEKISKEFMELGVNFQNYNILNSDITSALVQMVVSGRFYDMAIFDMEIFQNHTAHIAGTLKAINPDIKIIALVNQDSENNFTGFDTVIYKPLPYQRFIKDMDDIYSQEFFGATKEIDYSKLDILIVEDVELNREYEKEMLNNFFSINCDTAVNGQEAVTKAKNKKYDAILMDMRMPIMDGLDATRAIREFDKDIPIICMSANVYKEDKVAASNSGMNDFIEKPLSKDDIENKLLKLINNEFSKEKKEIKEEIKSSKVVGLTGKEMKQKAYEHLGTNFNKDIANKLLSKALKSISDYKNRVEVSFSNKDTKALVEDFHVIKGVCSNIGLSDIATKAGKLQKIAEKGDFLAINEPKTELLDNLTLLLNEKD
jgi:CheY-like chemotaxis protein/nitrogen-specific signal transduction histidine kinase